MSIVSEIAERLRALLFRSREEREMDEELRFHVERQTEKLVREGVEPREAKRRARLKLGGVEQTKESVRSARGVHVVENLVRDARHALRRLRREPGFAVPMVATVALGIGVATAVFALVNAVLLRPLPYPDADRLVEVRHAAPRAELAVTGLSPGIFLHYREHSRAFNDIGVYQEDVRALTDLGAPAQVRVALVSPSLFAVLGAVPYRGRLPTATSASDGRTGVVISHDLWVRRYGGDPDIVGRTIEIDRRPNVVLGVARPGFHFPDPETQVWITRQMQGLLDRFGGRAAVGGLFLSGVARLRSGVSREEAERDLDRLVRTLPDAYPDVTTEQLDRMGLHTVVAPLKEAVVGDVRTALLLLLGAAGVLLLMTWANATNLCLARCERQRREVAVQRALGATDRRLASRFLSESVLIAGIAGALGLVVAYVAVELRFGFEPGQIPRLRTVVMDGTGLGVGVGFSLVTGLILVAVSLFGARRPAGFGGVLAGGLGRLTAGRREQAGRRLLVAGQVALAFVLLHGSALMARSYWQLAQVELGFESEAALTFSLPLPSSEYPDYEAAARVHREVRERIGALPGVEAVEAATVSAFPLTPVPDYYISRVRAPDRPAADTATSPHAIFGLATPGYFRAMGVRPLQGGALERAALEREPAVVLSATLARAVFGAEDPIGRRVRLDATGESEYVVAGVVDDVPSRTLRDGPSNVLYFPHLHPAPSDSFPVITPRTEQYVVRTSAPSSSLVPAIRRSIQQVDPKLAMTSIGTLEDLVDDSMARARLTMLLLSVGAGTALLLGLIGIYGVLSYTVRRRTSELGVRIALGASPTAIVRMVVRQGALLALGGIALGLAAAFGLTRLLGGLLYEVSPTDPVAFTAVPALLFAVALAAGYVPARRAGRIDPVRALKTE